MCVCVQSACSKVSVTLISLKCKLLHYRLRMSSLCTGKKNMQTKCSKHLYSKLEQKKKKNTSRFLFLAATFFKKKKKKTLSVISLFTTFPRYHNCIAYSSLHTFTITTVQLKHNLSSDFFSHYLIFLHVHREPDGGSLDGCEH